MAIQPHVSGAPRIHPRWLTRYEPSSGGTGRPHREVSRRSGERAGASCHLPAMASSVLSSPRRLSAPIRGRPVQLHSRRASHKLGRALGARLASVRGALRVRQVYEQE